MVLLSTGESASQLIVNSFQMSLLFCPCLDCVYSTRKGPCKWPCSRYLNTLKEALESSSGSIFTYKKVKRNKGIDYGVKEHLSKQGREKKENSKIFRCEERPCDGRGSTFLLILFYETVW